MSRQVIVWSKTGSRGTGRLVRHWLGSDETRTLCGRTGWAPVSCLVVRGSPGALMERVTNCRSCARIARSRELLEAARSKT